MVGQQRMKRTKLTSIATTMYHRVHSVYRRSHPRKIASLVPKDIASHKPLLAFSEIQISASNGSVQV